MIGSCTSPWPGYIAVIRSDCSVLVGRPVDGPPRWMSATTSGISAIHASPSPSLIREKPGPAVPVIAFLPAKPAPMMLVIDSISDVAWYTNLPGPARLLSSQTSSEVAGEIGYPT